MKTRLIAGSTILALILAAQAGCPSKKKDSPPPDARGSGEFALRHADGAGWNTKAVALGDVDGDGDLDAFVCNFGEQNRLLLNDGSGEFTDGTDVEGLLPTGLPARQDRTWCAVFGDVDGDGDLDIVAGNNGQNYLLVNDGSGEFTDGTDHSWSLPTGLPQALDDTRAMALVNVDGYGGFDSDLDLVIVNNGQNRLYLNNGFGEFLDGTDLAGTFTTGLPLDSDPGRGILVFNADADVGGDTDMDLLILNEGAPNRLYVNSTGLGEYVDSSFDTLGNAASIPYLSDVSRDAAALDLDNDGLLDLVTATAGTDRILLNRGAGLFTEGTSHWVRERVLAKAGLNALTGSSVPYTVMCAGNSGALTQSSGSGAWSVLGAGVTTSDLLAAWSVPGSNTLFACGRGGAVVSNSTGTFIQLVQSVSSRDLKAVTGTSANSVWFGGAGGKILKYDGAAFSLEREFTEGALSCVHAAGSGAVFLGGANGTVLKGSTAGFAATPTGVSSLIKAFHHVSASDVYAACTGGVLLRYWDGGTGAPLAWHALASPTLYSLNAAAGRPGEVWIAGDYDAVSNEFTLLKDTGAGFAAVTPGLGFGENLNGIWVDPANGNVFAAGDLGVMIRYDAALATWADDTPALGFSSRLMGIDGTASNNVIAAGDLGIVLHYDGSGWSRHDSPSGAAFRSVWMADATNVWLVGAAGAIEHLDLSTWTFTPVAAPPTSRNLNGVHGLSSSDIYAAGDGGILIHYDGSSWRVNSSGAINGMFTAGPSDIFAVGELGLALRGDGAGNWTPFTNIPTGADLLAVWAPLPNQVYAVGRGGVILYFDGSSWTSQVSPTSADLYAVFGAGATVWAAGDGGVVIKNAGAGWVDSSSDPSLWIGAHDRVTALWASSTSDVYACTVSGNLHRFTSPGAAAAAFVPPLSDDSHAIEAIDLNGDSRLDLVVANNGQSKAWLNMGTGTLTDDTVARLPSGTWPGAGIACGGLYWNGVTWNFKRSLDADSDADLLIACAGAQSRLLVNGGSGMFADGTDATGALSTGLPLSVDSRAAAAGDVDGDGLADVVVGRWGTSNRLLLSRGGDLVDSSAIAGAGLPADAWFTSGLALFDADSDGDLDLAVANFGGAQKLLLNDGAGSFSEPGTPLLPADVFDATCVAAVDVDNDGKIDLVFGVDGAPNRLYLNGPSGFVQAASAFPAHSDSTLAVAVIDANKDGRMDVVFGNSGQRCRLYVNDMIFTSKFDDGTTGFTTGLPDATAVTRAVIAADFDLDGDADLVLVNYGSQNVLLANDGNGMFTDGTDLGQAAPTGLPAGNDDGTCGVAADVDHDGDLDLIFGVLGGQNRLLINDGLGEFADGTDEIGAAVHGLPPDGNSAIAVAAPDFDGDGDPDLYFACKGADVILENK